MRQCVLRKGNRYKTAWIPAEFAVTGKAVKLMDEDGWIVVSVGMYQKTVEEPHGYLSGGVASPARPAGKGRKA